MSSQTESKASQTEKLAPKSAATSENEPFAIGARISHKSWEQGQVLRHDDGKIVVVSDAVGCKTLSVAPVA